MFSDAQILPLSQDQASLIETAIVRFCVEQDLDYRCVGSQGKEIWTVCNNFESPHHRLWVLGLSLESGENVCFVPQKTKRAKDGTLQWETQLDGIGMFLLEDIDKVFPRIVCENPRSLRETAFRFVSAPDTPESCVDALVSRMGWALYGYENYVPPREAPLKQRPWVWEDDGGELSSGTSVQTSALSI